jgi:hypothetical protein
MSKLTLTTDKIITDWKKDELKGKVKSIKITNSFLPNEDSKTEDKQGENVENIFYNICLKTYNDKGMLIEDSKYNCDGKFDYHHTYKYNDDKVNLKEKTEISYDNTDGSLKWKRICTCDNNNLIEDATYNCDGRLEGKNIDKYDGKKWIGTDYYDSVGLYRKSICEYDDGDKLKEINHYNAEGCLEWKTIIKHEEGYLFVLHYSTDNILEALKKYNKKDLPIEKIYYFPNGSLEKRFAWQYDVTEYLMYDHDGVLEEKSIYRYNVQSQKIREWNYCFDGTLKGKSTYQYNKQGDIIKMYNYGFMGCSEGKVIYEYTYDHNNNWIECIEHAYGGLHSGQIIKRIIEYYDEINF